MFFYQQRQSQRNVEIKSIETVRNDDFETIIKIKGKDFYGTWKGEGGFIITENGPFFWMFKDYDDKDKAGQTGLWDILVY